eukprot:5462096-Prymnesium_polylepis.1
MRPASCNCATRPPQWCASALYAAPRSASTSTSPMAQRTLQARTPRSSAASTRRRSTAGGSRSSTADRFLCRLGYYALLPRASRRQTDDTPCCRARLAGRQMTYPAAARVSPADR